MRIAKTFILGLFIFWVLPIYSQDSFNNNCQLYFSDTSEYRMNKSISYFLLGDKYDIKEIKNSFNGDRFIMIIQNDTIFKCNRYSSSDNLSLQNFSLDKIEKTKKGFYFSISYGSINFYSYSFYFELKNEEGYFLKKIDQLCINKKNGKGKKRRLDLKKIVFEEFNIDDFL